MEKIDASECQVNVFVCTFEREGRSCCKKVGGQEFYQELKARVKAEGLYDTHWITRTGCLGFCNDVGTTVALFRRGEAPQYQNEVKPADLETIWKEITR